MSFGVTLYLNLYRKEMASATLLISDGRCVVPGAINQKGICRHPIVRFLTGESPCASLKPGCIQPL